MYSDAAIFASQRLKPAKARFMTVEIEQATLLRNNTAPASINTTPMAASGTPSIGTPAQNGSGTSSPSPSVMSAPTASDSIINRGADPAQGLYQTCLTLRERLRDVPEFEKFLKPPEDAVPNVPEDPVTQLWRCFRMGSSLCVLFNATRPTELIEDARLSPSLKTVNDCKAATFHFLKGIKQELHVDGDDAFMIHNLYSDDTNGFVKVTRTVQKILDILKERDLLLHRGSTEASPEAEKKPLDSRARVVKELVDTERKYVQDLEILQEYMRCLEREEVVSKDLIHNLFLNLNQLVDFQRRFLIRVETQNSLQPEQQNWGNLFVQYEKSFTVYEPYASNFYSAQLLAQESRDQLMKMPHPVLDNLSAFLIKPVQRVTKYPLLLRDLIKYTPVMESEEKSLPQGLEAIERINSQINEAIRKAENAEIVKDLEGRVEDWKGHKLEHFGELLLHGQFSVIKGDTKGEVEREYYIYLFERILLCCKEIGVGKKQNKTMSVRNARGAVSANKKKTNLQLKGRIFMQNVTDVISISRNGSYTLQIFWKGDPGVENFMIKHANDEGLTHWKKILQRQTEQYTRGDGPGRARGSGQSTAATQFAWMANTDPGDHHQQDSRDVSDDDDDVTVVHDGYNPHTSATTLSSQLSGTTLSSSRNGSTTSLRSRSATNEKMPPPPGIAAFLPRGQVATPPTWYPPQSHTPPLTLNTNPAIQALANSPERGNGSYFSPVETPSMSRTASAASAQAYPFPRYPGASGYYDEPGQYTPISMSRSSSRDGPNGTTSYAPFQNNAAYQNSQRLQRPSLPGMSSATQVGNQQSRMRSASSPNIHHLPGSSSLSRVSPGGNIPPVPTLPGSYIPYSGGPAVINRSETSSPTSPQLPSYGLVTDDRHDYRNGSNGVLTPPPNGKSQVKVKIHYNNDTLAIIVPFNIAYAQLMDRIERKVRICGNGPEIAPSTSIRIRYQDEDGDYISMNSDDDVLMAFDVGSEQVTLYVYLA